MKAAPTPAVLLRRAEQWLAAHADPRRAEGAKAYFHRYEPVLYGVAVPEARRLARALTLEVRGRWTVREAVAFADRCTERSPMESKCVGWFVLGRFAKDFPATLAGHVRRWILGGRCDNWALVDALSAEVLAPWIERFPERLGVITGWHASANPWLRRASVVPLVRSARRGRHLDAAYTTVEALFGDREDLMHKACGWLLREAGKTDMARLERFLRAHWPRIPRTTLRYAIERFPPVKRRALLTETRGGRVS